MKSKVGDIYKFDKCDGCGKYTMLKNDKCLKCNTKKYSFGKMFDGIFEV